MSRLAVLLGVLLLGLSQPVQADPPAMGRLGAFARQQLRHPRVAEAARERLPAVEADFREAAAAWPPRGVFIRGFKTEGQVELWAAPEDRSARSWVLVRTFPVCAASGALGPKRQMGDLQVPEGFYHVNVFNPYSDFHLSLGVSYPNAADRFHSGRRAPGYAIMVHGNCVTIGCLPLQDGPIEDLYLAAVMARDSGQSTIPIHLFPCRLDDPACASTLATAAAERPDLQEFWEGLRPGYDAFTATKVPPVVRANRDGTYTLVTPRKTRSAS